VIRQRTQGAEVVYSRIQEDDDGRESLTGDEAMPDLSKTRRRKGMEFRPKRWIILRMKPLRLRLGSMERSPTGVAYCELGLREERRGISDYALGYPVWSFFLFHDGVECEIKGIWTK